LSYESSNTIEKYNSEISVTEERIVNNKENYARYETEIEDIKTRLLELEDEKKQKLDKKTNLYSNKEKFEKELAEKEQELASITAKLSSKQTEIEEKKKVVQDNIDLRYEILSEINTYDINFENTEKQEKH
jgi:chromosome segregation ATPase